MREAERAEQVAIELRRAHGSEAEAWCDAQRSRLAQGDPELRLWSDVRRSLRWVKNERPDRPQSSSVANR